MRTFFLPRRWLVRLSALAVVLMILATAQLLGQNEQVNEWVSAGLDGGAPVFSAGEAENGAVSWLVQVTEEADEQILRQMLSVLAENHARVTFFIGREFAAKESELLLALQAGGHQLGVLGASADGVDVKDGMAEAAALLAEATGEVPLLFLPENGVAADDVRKAAAELGLIFVLGGVDSGDWQAEKAEEIIAEVLQQAEAGSFVTISPSETSVAALKVLLPELAAKGLSCCTVAENLTRPKSE